MNRMKYIIISLFMVICACHGCILESIDEIEFGVACQDVSYILDNGNYCIHTTCDEYDSYMNAGHCPTEFDCIQDPNGKFYCGNVCEKGYHIYRPEDLEYAICEVDSTENCGAHDNNCLQKEGWRNGTCEEGNCKLIDCHGAYQPVDNACKSLRQCCGPNCKDCTMVAGWVCSDDDCVESGCKSSNEILCDGICFDPTSNVSYCGSDDRCEPHECRSDQVCIDSECDCKDHADECEGECKDHATDLEHCGECHHACSEAEGWLNGICSEGKCVAQVCQEGYHVEENEDGIGVCVEDSTEACGEFAINCTTDISGWQEGQCLHAVCIVEACQPGFFLLKDEEDPSFNRCMENTDENCGDVNRQCAIGHYCDTEIGACACDGGLYECDDGLCYDIQIDAQNCGGCGIVCARDNATGQCVSGQCVYECKGDYIECDNVCYEINDVNHCGTCENACTTEVVHAHPTCESQTCGYACDESFENCSGSCYDLTSTPEHCGDCDTACPIPEHGTATCVSSRCGIECQAEYFNCSEKCVDLKTDNNHCGACNTPCVKPDHGSVQCTDSKCKITCDSGYKECSEQCVDLKSDENHCGSCDTRCNVDNAYNSCADSKCTFTCKDGYVMNSAKTGCDPRVCTEGAKRCDGLNYQTCSGNQWVTTQTCTAPTNGTPSCNSSGCSWSCNTDYKECTTGSCVNIKTSSSHCGGCNKPCNAVSHGTNACSNGSCTITCDSGYVLNSTKTGCDPKVCTEGAKQCDRLNYQTCSGNQWVTTQACSAPDNATASCSTSGCSWSCNYNYVNCNNSCIYYTSTGIFHTYSNIYATPSTSTPLDIGFDYNYIEWIYGKYNGYYAVYTGSQKGYVPASTVYILPAYGHPWNTSGVNVRTGPSTSYSITTAIAKNTTVTIEGYSSGTAPPEGGGWYYISYPAEGYISSYYVTMTSGSSDSSLPSCP